MLVEELEHLASGRRADEAVDWLADLKQASQKRNAAARRNLRGVTGDFGLLVGSACQLEAARVGGSASSTGPSALQGRKRAQDIERTAACHAGDQVRVRVLQGNVENGEVSSQWSGPAGR